ncbi:MAG TPA: caspase family protein [Pyrinomonadaceae bacterium]|nr:caspase family protein [Pyrinomonadaceae bacterium]
MTSHQARKLGTGLLLTLIVACAIAQAKVPGSLTIPGAERYSPRLLIPIGHSTAILSVAFSPDGRFAMTGGADWNAILWNVGTGKELRRLEGHTFHVTSVAFSPDSKLALTAAGNKFAPTVPSVDKTARLWDVATGKEVRRFEGHTDGIWSAAFSPDGRWVVTGSSDKTARLWSATTGREVARYDHPATVESVAFSPTGTSVLTGCSDGKARLWKISSGAETQQFTGHKGRVTAVAFSHDGRLIATGGQDETARLWDAATGDEIKRVSDGYQVQSVSFSPDDRTLLVNSVVHDVTTGKALRYFETPAESLATAAFSRDGQLVLTASAGASRPSALLWNADTGKLVNEFAGLSGAVRAIALSNHTRYVCTASSNRMAAVWDVRKGEVGWRPSDYGIWSRATDIERHHSSFGLITYEYAFESCAFSPDGRFLATGFAGGVILWDAATGSPVKSFRLTELIDGKITTLNSEVNAIAFSPDGVSVFVAGRNIVPRLWNVSSNKEVKRFGETSLNTNSVAYSPNSRFVLTGDTDNAARLWDVASGKELKRFGVQDAVNSVAFSPDGSSVLIGSGGYQALGSNVFGLWNSTTGGEIRKFKGHTSGVNSGVFSPDGQTVLSGSFDGTARLWNAKTGREIRRFNGHSDSVRSVTFSSDGRFILTGGNDGTTRYWDAFTGQELCRLISFADGNWVVLTPEGLFDGSPAGWNRLSWRFSPEPADVAPVESFFSEYYYPGLLADIFAGKRPKAPSDISQKDRRPLGLRLAFAGGTPAANLRTRTASMKIDVSEVSADKDHKSSSGAQDVRLFRNGSLVRVWHGDVLNGNNSVTLETTIPIVAGENKFTAYAFNHDNIKSSDAELVVTGADTLKRQGTAYVLAVGVNNYANEQYNLKYAVADAEDFAAEIKRQQEPLKKYAKVEVISLSDAAATKANITQRLADLAKQVQPEDAVIVFFAGHGTAQGNQFYLIPHDLGYQGPRENLRKAGLDTILAHSISDRELEILFETIDAGQLLLVIDACNSGQALEAEEKRRGPMNSKGLAQLAYEKGMYVLTAAQSYQAAQEAAKFGHGFLTYALVEEGLKQGAADREPKNGSIDIREWLNFATDEVPKMQEDNSLEALRGRGRYVVFVGDGTGQPHGRDNSNKPGDEKARDNIQRPRVFYRRELEANPMVIAIPK